MSSFYASVPPEQRQALETFRGSDRQRMMRIDGREWRYVSTGEGEHTLVILPGGFARADMWLRPILNLESEYRTLAIDASLEVFAAGPFCDAVFEILDREGVDTFTALGCSYGGGLVQHLLHHHSERLEHAVLSHCTPVSPRVLRLCGSSARLGPRKK